MIDTVDILGSYNNTLTVTGRYVYHSLDLMNLLSLDSHWTEDESIVNNIQDLQVSPLNELFVAGVKQNNNL